MQPAVARGGEVGHPVVVGTRQDVGRDRVLDQRVVLEKQRRVDDRVIDPERVHVGESRARVARAGVERVVGGRVETADVVERHPRAPDRLAVDGAAVQLLRGSAVEHGEATAVVVLEVPERGSREAFVTRGHVRVPQRRRLEHVAVGVDDGKRLLGHRTTPDRCFERNRVSPHCCTPADYKFRNEPPSTRICAPLT